MQHINFLQRALPIISTICIGKCNTFLGLSSMISMGIDKFLKVGGGGANDVFLLEITSIAHFSHAHESF